MLCVALPVQGHPLPTTSFQNSDHAPYSQSRGLATLLREDGYDYGKLGLKCSYGISRHSAPVFTLETVLTIKVIARTNLWKSHILKAFPESSLARQDFKLGLQSLSLNHHPATSIKCGSQYVLPSLSLQILSAATPAILWEGSTGA